MFEYLDVVFSDWMCNVWTALVALTSRSKANEKTQIFLEYLLCLRSLLYMSVNDTLTMGLMLSVYKFYLSFAFLQPTHRKFSILSSTNEFVASISFPYHCAVTFLNFLLFRTFFFYFVQNVYLGFTTVHFAFNFNGNCNLLET